MGNMKLNPIAATDVSERYRALAARWYEQNGLPPDRQRLMLDIHPRIDEVIMVKLADSNGKVLEEQPLPTTRDDMRKFATFSLPREGQHYLVFPGEIKFPVQATQEPVHILRLMAQ